LISMCMERIKSYDDVVRGVKNDSSDVRKNDFCSSFIVSSYLTDPTNIVVFRTLVVYF
jgi:hypothetical protein